MKVAQSTIISAGLMFLALATEAGAQFIVMENCAEKVVADSGGFFSLHCEVKNLAARGDFSVLAFCDNASVDITPRHQILNRGEVAQLTIRGQLVDRKKDGLVEINLQWADYDAKLMVTKHEFRILPPMMHKD
jgi:hypothetical protein